MKHLFLILAAMAVLPPSHAAPRNEEEEPFSVVIPVVRETERGEFALVSELNRYLPREQKFPSYVEVKTADEANEIWGKLGARFDEIEWDQVAPEAKTGEFTSYSFELAPFTASYTIPGTRKKTSMCYRGENPQAARELTGFVAGLSDSVLSDGFYMYGHKYKRETVLDEDVTQAMEEDPSLTLPALWNEWRGRGEAVLFLYSNMYRDEWHHYADFVKKCR